MPQAIDKPRPDLWGVLNDLDNEVFSLRMIEGLLFELINEHSTREPFTDQEHEKMCWLVSQLGDANKRTFALIRKAFGEDQEAVAT
jgi:hypothetical protein